MLTPSSSNAGRNRGSLSSLAAVILAFAMALTAVSAIGVQAAGARAPGARSDKHSKYYRAALAAAKKYDGRHTSISRLKEAKGFARALIYNPSRSPQDYLAVFRVRSVRSMKVVAAGSVIDPISLVELHMPFRTQVRLTWSGSEIELRHAVAEYGQYGGTSTPGYSGFDGSFGRRGWEIDAGIFESLEHAMKKAIHRRNAHGKDSKKVIDVDAAYKLNRHSKLTFNQKTHETHFTLTLVFVNRTGTFTRHSLGCTIHPGRAGGVPAHETYSLDGHHLPR